MLKKLSLGIVLALVLSISAIGVYAADPTPTPAPVQPSFNDGRINAYDPGAPVAVFETRHTVPIVNDNGVPTTGDVVNAVQLLSWDGASAKEVLYVPIADIDAVINKMNGTTKSTATTLNNSTSNLSGSAANTSSSSNSSLNTTTANTMTTNNTANMSTTTKGKVDTFVIAKKNGYTLGYSNSGYLWISTPPDFEGKVYTFSWQKDF